MDKFLTYIETFLKPSFPETTKFEMFLGQRDDIMPSVGLHSGAFLAWLIQLTNVKTALEFGTSIGYSAIILGSALKKNGGRLITIEYDQKHAEEAKTNISKAKLTDVVEVIHGDAAEVILNIDDQFDFIFQDSDKFLYPKMLEWCISHVKQHGIIAADDALFPVMDVPEKYKDPISEYNKKVFSDRRLASAFIALGDGLIVSTKL